MKGELARALLYMGYASEVFSSIIPEMICSAAAGSR